MRRLPLLVLLPAFALVACIERTPQADDDPPLECAPQDCGERPDLAGCPDGTSPAIACAAQDGVCQWAIERCAEPAPPEPTPPDPEPPSNCAPADCGPRESDLTCEPGFERAFLCADDGGGCVWEVSCRAAEPACAPDDCGPPPAGEPCGPDTRPISDCRPTRRGCEWYMACEPIECAPTDCPADPVRPNCEHTMECVPMGGACDWLFECVPPVCEQPWDAGSCDGAEAAWWYNSAENTCELVTYGGCGGNENRFQSEAACFESCGLLGK